MTKLNLSYPNGGESFNVGDFVLVQWSSIGLNPANHLYVFFDDGAGLLQQSGAISPAETSWLWPVPDTPTTGGWLWIGTWTGSGWAELDHADGPIAVRGDDDLIFADGFGWGDVSFWE